MKILVVDDKLENIYLLESLLSSDGYETAAATNGEEAYELARKTHFDLIISDVLMPVMDGFTFCRACKSDDQLRNVPFIFYTATYTEPKDEEFALSLGAMKYILKPQEPDKFLEIVKEVIREVKSDLYMAPEIANVPEDFVLREYNSTLVRKLEDKMRQTEENEKQLKQLVEELQASLEERIRAEGIIQELNRTLEIRVRERTSQLIALNDELEAFSYSVSHDLRAPLRAIDGFVNILLVDYGARLDSEGIRLCSVISDSARKMSKMIEDLLTFSHLGRTEIKTTTVDMETLVHLVFDELAKTENVSNISFHVSPLPLAVGDPKLLHQVWMNLLSNSLKFSSKKEQAVIEVFAEQVDDEVIYTIRDNGAGFDMQYVDKLFGVFQRMHSAEEFEGTGVGLSIVARIIHRHGGRVWAEGALDQGATFHFTLKRQS